MCNRNHINGADNKIVFNGICRKRLSFNPNVDVDVSYGNSGYIEKCLFRHMFEGMGCRLVILYFKHTHARAKQYTRSKNGTKMGEKEENNELNATTFAPKIVCFYFNKT